jgi:hypothetical protein
MTGFRCVHDDFRSRCVGYVTILLVEREIADGFRAIPVGVVRIPDGEGSKVDGNRTKGAADGRKHVGVEEKTVAYRSKAGGDRRINDQNASLDAGNGAVRDGFEAKR